MAKAVPTVQKYMTMLPHTIGVDQPLAKAEEMMRRYRVRHLPVLDGGKLVGILSDRDIKLVETLKEVDPQEETVAETYTPDPYMTTPTASLSDVCAQMAEHKYGCVLVCDNYKLVGIFTWVDALRAFSELMETRLKH